MTPKRRALNLAVIFACLCFSKSLLIKRLTVVNKKVSLLKLCKKLVLRHFPELADLTGHFADGIPQFEGLVISQFFEFILGV